MAADKKNTANAPKDESVADILNAIKDIVEGEPGNNNTVDVLDATTDDEEFLELTDVVEEIDEQPINTVEPAINKVEDKPLDILDEIDNALAVDAEPEVEDQKAVLEELMKTLLPEAEKAKLEGKQEPAPEEAAEEPAFAQVSEFDEVVQNEINAEPEVAAEVALAPEPEEIKVAEQLVEEPIQNISTPKIIQPPKHLNPINTNLLSAEKAQKSHLAIQNLLNNIPKPEILSPAMRNGTTIEDIVVESMKPLLKEWLDQNLEIIVRDIVEREIKKLVPHE